MPKHLVPTRYCRCGACTYVRRVKSSPTPTGIADLPGFTESLRLLVSREEYSVTDIALMFGVSRQRMYQLIDKLHIPRHDYPKGLQSVRVWDDKANRFRPVGRGALTEQRKETKRAIRRRVREGYKQHVLSALATVPTDRPVSLREIWHAVSGEWVTSTLACARWSYICGVLGMPQRYDTFKDILRWYGITMYGVGQSAPERKPKGPRGNEETILNVLMAHHAGLKPVDIEATINVPRTKAYSVLWTYAR